MMKPPAARLLPITIVTTAILLGLKSVSLGQAALASDQPTTTSQATQAETNVRQTDKSPASTVPIALPTIATKASPAPMLALEPSDWQLLQDLRSRRQALDERERALDLRDAAIEAAAHTLQTRIAGLQALQDKIVSLEATRQQRSEGAWTGIVKVYEAMKPADAAAIFDALDPRLLVQILDRMNERKAALVMGGMEPERARLATQMLAIQRQRENANPAEIAVPDSQSKPSSNG